MSLTSISKKIPFTPLLQQHTPPPPPQVGSSFKVSFVSYLLKSPEINTRSNACSNSSTPMSVALKTLSTHVY